MYTSVWHLRRNRTLDGGIVLTTSHIQLGFKSFGFSVCSARGTLYCTVAQNRHRVYIHHYNIIILWVRAAAKSARRCIHYTIIISICKTMTATCRWVVLARVYVRWRRHGELGLIFFFFFVFILFLPPPNRRRWRRLGPRKTTAYSNGPLTRARARIMYILIIFNIAQFWRA